MTTRKLPAIVEDIGKVPTAYREAYDKIDDGRWVLQVEPVDNFALGDLAGAKADADRCFAELTKRVTDSVLNEALKRAGGNRTLLEPHLQARVEVDRKTFATRILGRDGKFTNLDSVIGELKSDPAFAAAFDDADIGNPTPGNATNLTDAMLAEKARRSSAATKASALVPKPSLDPRSGSFNLSAAMAWARGNPERTAELQRAHAGRRQ